MIAGDYTHCPHCGTLLQDRGWCRHCGDIESLDEFKDQNPSKPEDQNPHLAAVNFAVNRLFK